MIEVLEKGNPEEQSDMMIAQDIGTILNRVYANHPWVIAVQSEGIIIRHLAIAHAVHRQLGRDGFASLLPRDKMEPKQLRMTVLRFAGELLEAFGLPRGAWDGRDPVVPVEWTYRQETYQ
jgi:hypothetical protein